MQESVDSYRRWSERVGLGSFPEGVARQNHTSRSWTAPGALRCDYLAPQQHRYGTRSKADIRPGYDGQLAAKVERVEQALAD